MTAASPRMLATSAGALFSLPHASRGPPASLCFPSWGSSHAPPLCEPHTRASLGLLELPVLEQQPRRLLVQAQHAVVARRQVLRRRHLQAAQGVLQRPPPVIPLDGVRHLKEGQRVEQLLLLLEDDVVDGQDALV